jgi:Leucine-rich repeat (LRR) protein
MTKILITVITVIFVVAFIVYKQDDKEVSISDTSSTTTKISDNNEKVDEAKKEDLVSNGEILDLSNQGLTKTPTYVFDKTTIQELDLSSNQMGASLQAEVRHLQNLKVLNLSNNQFTGVPAEIGQLKNLEVLDLSNNQITGLPYELGNLKNLKVLNLKGNAYSAADLAVIKQSLSASTVVQVD